MIAVKMGDEDMAQAPELQSLSLKLKLGQAQSRDDRYLFLRRYWYGDGIRQIADTMGITPHKASVRLFRLRQKLQTYLQKEGMTA